MLLTFSCKTSLDRQVVFMWMWIPNKQRLSFCWVFQFAVSKLVPLHARQRIRLLRKDGDPQQRAELMPVIGSIFPLARESGCGWHIGESPRC